MKTVRRRVSRLLLIVTLLSLIPRGSASAMPRGFTTIQAPTSVPAILDAPPNNYKPAGAQSDVIPAAYAHEIGPQIEPTHQPGFFDGTFSGAARKRMAYHPGVIKVDALFGDPSTNFKDLPFNLPANTHDSVQMTVKAQGAIWESGGNYYPESAQAMLWAKPVTATDWLRMEVFKSPATDTPSPLTPIHATFRTSDFPPNVTLQVRFGCEIFYETTGGWCEFSNLEFYDDAPGWERKVDSGKSPLSVHETAGIFQEPLGGITPEAGGFWGWDMATPGGLANTNTYLGPIVQMPLFSPSDVFTASLRWAAEAPGTAQSIEVRFLNPLLGVDKPLATTGTSSVTPTPGWHSGPSTIIEHQFLAGKRGYIALVLSTFLTPVHRTAIDSIQFYLNGRPFNLLMPADQQLGKCKCNESGHVQVTFWDPVTTFAGNFTIEDTDLALDSTGFPLEFGRTYMSSFASRTSGYPATTIGYGWRHTYAAALTLPTQPGGEPSTVIYEAATGNRYRFIALNDGSYYSTVGVRASLVRQGTAPNYTYKLTLADQGVLEFNASGQLTKLTDEQGHSQTVAYDLRPGYNSTNQVQTVTDMATGRQLAFSYFGAATSSGTQPRLKKVEILAGGLQQTVVLTYNSSGNLFQVKDTQNVVTSYVYDNATAEQLKEVYNAATTTGTPQVRNTYTNGKVTQQVLASGQTVSYAYAIEAGTQDRVTTITTTGPGQAPDVFKYHYRADGTLRYVERNGQFLTYNTFGNGLGPAAVADGEGGISRMTTNAAGQPTQIKAPNQLTTNLIYDAKNHPTEVQSPDGHRTKLIYNTDGTIKYLVATAANGTLPLTTTYTYDKTWLLPKTETRPDGVVTWFDYNATGQLITRIEGYGTSDARTTAYYYDPLGRLTNVTAAANTSLATTTHTDYAANGHVWRVIENYVVGGSVTKTRNVIAVEYGYDSRANQIWSRSRDGVYHGFTYYNAAGQVLWTVENPVNASGVPTLPTGSTPPAFSLDRPEANIATLYKYDGLGRTELVTQTGILTGTFSNATQQFSAATTRMTRYQYDALSRPVTVTLNYRPTINGGQFNPAVPDVNVQTLTYYDGAGRVQWQRDTFMRWTKTEYDLAGRVVKTIRNYENGNPTTVDQANKTWTNGSDTDLVTVSRYNALGQFEGSIENYVDGVLNTGINEVGFPYVTDRITDHMTLNTYDALGRLAATTLNYAPTLPVAESYDDFNVQTQSTLYHPTTGQVQAYQDISLQWNAPRYDGLGRVFYTVQNCRNASGAVVSSGWQNCGPLLADRNVRSDAVYYNPLGQVTDVRNVLDIFTHTNYDELGQPIESIQNHVAGGAVNASTNVKTTTSYLDMGGHAWSVTDPTNRATTFQSNLLGQTVMITDAANLVTRMGYDATGQRWTKQPDGLFNVTFVDGLGRTKRMVDNYADGNEGYDTTFDLATHTRYDAAGRMVASIDSLGRETDYAYDLMDRLVQVTENVKPAASCPTSLITVNGASVNVTSCNVVTQYRYDRVGNRTAVIDARGNVNTTIYDALGRVAVDDNAKQYTYNQRNQVIEIEANLNGQSRDFVYDEMGRLIKDTATVMVDDLEQRFTYDRLGRRTSFYDESAATVGETGVISYTFDPLNRITNLASSLDGDTVSGVLNYGYGYDAAGRVLQIGTTNYEYDVAGRPWKVKRGTTLMADYGYDSVGRPQTRQHYNGGVLAARTTTAYDAASRVQSLTSVGLPSNRTLSTLTYTYDRGNQPLTLTEMQSTTWAAPATTQSNYVYDGMGRLFRETYGPTTTEFSYDMTGNRVQTRVNGTVANQSSYNADNQISNAGYEYDEDGNLLRDGAKTYSYDPFNRLKSVLTGGSTYGYRYHGETMASKYVNNVRTSSFIYDTATPGHSRLLRVRDLTVAGTVYADHAYGPNDDLLWRDQYTNGTTTTNGNFLTDRLGTTRQVYNPSNGYSFPVSGDSWGANAGTGLATEMRFTGEYSDLNTGLVFLRARWYNPAAGTFLSRDPFEGIANYPYSRHQYQYGYSKPTANTDPSGRFGPAACAAMAVADGPIPVGDAAAIACLTFLGISAIVAASTVWNREALEQFADACEELVRNFDDRPWFAPRPDVNTDTNVDVDIAPAPQPEPEPEPTLVPFPAPWDRPVPVPFKLPRPQSNPQPQPTVMPTPQPTAMPTPTTRQEAYVADTNIFTDRPDVTNPSVRQHIDTRYLSNPNVTIYVPAAVDRELAQWVSPMQVTRRQGYGANIISIPDGSLAGINTAALESNAFDYNDMAILQTAKDLNLPLLTTNSVKLQNQILAKQFPDRRKLWSGVTIMYP